jgi:RNA polymerase sigma-70 factor, ECF subfamily
MTMSGVRPTEPVKTEDLFRSHAPYVARLLTRLGVSTDELDDAVQEVFLVVHRNGGYIPGPATPTGYLASIALRAASSHRRRGRKRRERRSEVSPDDVSSAGLDPARSLEVQQSLDELQGALDQLAPDLRATLVLAELEGESCLSIAATMQIAVGTVYWRLHRARKSFRNAIESRRVAERRAEALAAGALLFGRPAEGVLETARANPGVGFDAASGLARLCESIRAGASFPPWALAATRTGIASGVGLTAPAVLSALVIVQAVGIGMSRWDGPRAVSRGPATAGMFASISPVLPDPVVPIASSPAPAGVVPSDEAVRLAVNDPPLAARAASVAPSGASRARKEPGVAPEPPRPSPWVETLDPSTEPVRAAPTEPPSPDAMAEIQQVAIARHLLASNPTEALSMVRSGETRFPSGYLREERRYIGVVALFKLGRGDEARA